MANKVTNFTDVKNLRQWLDTQLGSDKYLYRRTSNGDVQCNDVSLMWDGTNYHIAYTTTENNETITVVLPFTYTDEIVWYIK